MGLKITDFKPGDKVYIMLTRNAERYIRDKNDPEQYVVETTVEKVGRKYLEVSRYSGVRFMEYETGDRNCLKQKTDCCVDYLLYRTKEEIISEKKREACLQKVSSFFGSCFDRKRTLTCDQLERIIAIIEE